MHTARIAIAALRLFMNRDCSCSGRRQPDLVPGVLKFQSDFLSGLRHILGSAATFASFERVTRTLRWTWGNSHDGEAPVGAHSCPECHLLPGQVAAALAQPCATLTL